MKRNKVLLSLFCVVVFVFLAVGSTGNDDEPTAKPEEVVEEPKEGEEVSNTTMVLPSYDVAEIEDLTFSNVKRFNWKVVIHDEVAKEELIMLSEHIVEEAKESADFNALSIMYYDYEEYIEFAGYTLGGVDYAPGGDWAKADTVSTGDYDKMSFKYKFHIKDWSQRLTQDEVNIWREWSGLVYDEAIDEDTATETVAETFNLAEDDVKAIINKQMSWTFQNLDE